MSLGKELMSNFRRRNAAGILLFLVSVILAAAFVGELNLVIELVKELLVWLLLLVLLLALVVFWLFRPAGIT
ncbi:MAG: hypothetical protein ABEK10_04635 [Candidatus Nanosalina sp.]